MTTKLKSVSAFASTDATEVTKGILRRNGELLLNYKLVEVAITRLYGTKN